ncbi:MAG: hypothetical protein ABI271_06830 [Nitrosospira sp.]
MNEGWLGSMAESGNSGASKELMSRRGKQAGATAQPAATNT